MSRVSTTVAAPIRTGAQLGVGFILVEFVAAFFATDWTERQFMAALGLATLLVTAVQHLVENRTGHAVLRDVPPTTAAVVSDEGHGNVPMLVVIAAVCVIVVTIYHLVVVVA